MSISADTGKHGGKIILLIRAQRKFFEGENGSLGIYRILLANGHEPLRRVLGESIDPEYA